MDSCLAAGLLLCPALLMLLQVAVLVLVLVLACCWY